jgi:3-hydroxyisobutyrate dehydrogenase-like beta-hydroxyacid dehydrogenase
METIAILMPGDMGHGIGRALAGHGHKVITCLEGRSERTRGLAAAAGLEDTGDLESLTRQADIILSILPPARALGQAQAVAEAMRASGARPVYVDCNAISPGTAQQVGEAIAAADAPFIDAGIIGLAPGKGGRTRIHVSGPDTTPMEALDGKGFEVIPLGQGIGRASALKMCYAGLTKGTWTLHTAVLLAGEMLGVSRELHDEFEISQQAALAAMERMVPRLPADSGRWIGEMEEIATTFSEAGVPSGFHEGAAEIFRILERTPFASETRETMDADRTVEESVSVYAATLRAKAAE